MGGFAAVGGRAQLHGERRDGTLPISPQTVRSGEVDDGRAGREKKNDAEMAHPFRSRGHDDELQHGNGGPDWWKLG